MLKVAQLENKNQFIIESENMLYFQSYQSLIASYNKQTQEIVLFTDWDYSRTTLKHLYLFIDYYVSNVYLNGLHCEKKQKKLYSKINQ